MSEPNTSEPLHSSCTRQAILQAGSPSAATSPNRYTVWPPIGGRNTLRSERVTSSGNMPPVCSNRWRRRSVSDAPQRAATPGSHHTGSIATLVQVTSPVAVTTPPVELDLLEPHRVLQLGHGQARPGHRDGRADVPAVGELLGERLADDVPVGIERHDPAGIRPLRVGPHRHRRRGIGQIGTMQLVQAAGGDREGAVQGVRAGVRADHVASGRIRQRADHGAARLGRGSPPVDLGRLGSPRPRMRGQHDVPARAGGIDNRAIGHGLAWPRRVMADRSGDGAIALARAEEYSNLVSV